MTLSASMIQILMFFVGAGGSALIAWGVSKQLLKDTREEVAELKRTIYPGDGSCTFVRQSDIRNYRGYLFVPRSEFDQWKDEFCRKMTGIREMLKDMDQNREDARKTTEGQNLHIQKTISRIETLIEEMRKDRK